MNKCGNCGSKDSIEKSDQHFTCLLCKVTTGEPPKAKNGKKNGKKKNGNGNGDSE